MARRRDALNPTRSSLIRQVKDPGNSLGWQEFYDTYRQLIYGVARQAGLSDPEAQDVVQETMISANKHLPTFEYDRAIGSFKSWLLKITRSRIVDQLRKRGPCAPHNARPDRTTTRTATADKVVDPASLVSDEHWERELQKAVLNAAIDNVKRRLDPQRYQIFDCYVHREWPPAKVAEAFGVSVDQVYLAKHRITALLKEEVKRLQKVMT